MKGKLITSVFGLLVRRKQKMKKLYITTLSVLILGFAGSAQATPYIFTNAGAEGIVGPTQASVDAAYSGTNLDGQVTVSATGIQQWIVQESGLYSISASGASGGSTTRAAGGLGATITTELNLFGGDVLNILVGQMGGLATFGGSYGGGETGGGGGGTFIVSQSNTPLLVAGGGGGGAEGGSSFNYVADGTDASPYFETSGQDGTSTAGSWSFAGAGGVGGNGGTKPGSGGAGGGGFLTDGQGNSFYSGDGGHSYLNGGAGGLNEIWSGTLLQDIQGGFGGGAGAGTHESYESNAGGGGGYSGGGGGNTRVGAGGGGGNYFIGDFVSAGLNLGHGQVTFNLLEPAEVPVPEPATVVLFALGLVGLGIFRRRIDG